MKIVQVSKYTAPARDAQGAQRVLEFLSRQLQKEGHEVLLLVNPDSVADFGTVISEIPDDVDVVHYHGGFPNEYGHDQNKFKWLTTSHGGAFDTKERMQEVGKYLDNLIFVSRFCARMYNSGGYIYNCVDPDDYIFREKKDNYFLWIAGTDWEEQKGLFTSISLAKKLNFNLKIAGGGKNQAIIEEIKKHCNNKIEYLGFVNGIKKAELIAGAKALLMIGNILDAAPLNNLEALVSGTPVIAKNIASHPEILNSEVGFICDTYNQIVKAILSVNKIDPRKCRDYVLENFSPEVTAKNYLRAYNKVIEHGSVYDLEPR